MCSDDVQRGEVIMAIDQKQLTAKLKTMSPWVSIFLLSLVPIYYISKGLLYLHRLRPLWTLAFYSGIFALLALVNGDWFIGLIWVAVPVLAFRYLAKPLAKYKEKKMFRKTVIALMEETLWNPEEWKVKTFVKISDTPMSGVMRVDFTTPMGQPDEAVLKVLPIFSAGLQLQSIVPLPDENAFDGVVSVLMCRTSPLETVLDGSKAPVLHLGADVGDPFHWLPVGVDANGSAYEVPLFLQEGGAVRQLCAGMSGSGKSSIVRQQLVQAVLNPKIDVAITDGKGSEFGLFAPYVQSFTRNPNAKEFFAQLRWLEEERDRRAEILNHNKDVQTDRFSQSWNPIDDGNFLLWVWDELGVVFAGFSAQQKSEAQSRIYGLLSVGRSLGIGCILSSQTFKADILSTQIRDNCFDVSLGFKMNSMQEGSYIGFDLEDEVHPARIKGKILKSGKSATVGTFAMKGIDREAYGRSYFISDQQIKHALRDVEPVSPKTSVSPMEIEEEDDKVFQSELAELIEQARKEEKS
jgi:hypothetical protein